MTISFEDSLKAAQEQVSATETTSVATTSLEENSIAALESIEATPLTADETTGAIPAYEGWMKPSNASVYTYYNDEYTDEKISTVDENKNISLNTSQINLTQEKNSQYIPFQIPRYYDGFDLTKTQIAIYWVNKLGNGGLALPVDVYYNSEKIRFAWLIDDDVTAIEGKLKFEIQASGTNSQGFRYLWKTKSNGELNVLQALEIKTFIEPDETWQETFISRMTDQANRAETASAQAASSAQIAQNAALKAQEIQTDLYNGIDAEVQESLAARLNDYYSKTEVDTIVDSIDVSDQLENYALKTYVQEQIEAIDISDELQNYALAEDVYTKTDADAKISATLESYATKQNVADAIADADISSKLNDYYTKSETYSKEEVDAALGNVQVDLTGYATEKFVTDKTVALSASISTNTSGISSLNKSVEEINKTIEGIDQSPRITYDATYGDVELDDGSTAEYMYTLWKTENGVREVQDRFQILGGGGGSGSSVTLRIAYIEGYTTPIVATVDDAVIIKYDFSGEDSAGDTNLDGVASWKIGNRVVATEDVSTGECEFDLTEYVSVGDNKVVLTITHATGAVATKAWTVKVVDVRLESSFDDTKTNIANQPVTLTFTPYGGVNKTIHFLLDGEEIGIKTSSAAAAGLSDSYTIPAHEHGAHLFEFYMTADINGKTIESNHIVKDIIWYDEDSDIPIIGCTQQKFTTRQYEATNISYTVYDPSTETPKVSLKATYVNEDGETVEEYNSDITMSSNTAVWQYKTDVIGEHILTITCGETVKTLTATVVELGIEVSPITAGLVFDFNPVGYSNDNENRLWSSGDIGMTVSDNFDWINGGYQIDENGDQCFCIKAGTSAEINYELFGDDAKTNGKQFKIIFRTENVSDSNTTFLSCLSDATGEGKNIGIEMKAQEANIYAKEASLPLPYAEEEIIEFEFNITASSETIPMVMGYEDGVSTRPMVYDDTHDFQQYQGYRVPISLGSDDCDLYIYRFKVYNKSLSDKDILNNFIADARSAEEMISRYDRNQIYKEGILDPDYLAEVCPDLRIIKLEVPHFTADKDDKVYDPNIQSIVECIYKNGDPIYDNWVAYDIVHSGQGTSSNNYGASGRNLDLILKSYKDYGNAPYIILGDGTQVNKVALTRESVPVNYFNVKVNIASSENANNAVFAKRYNQYNPYKRPFVREDASIIPHIKDTMEFQNCVIFLKESDPDLSTHVEFNDDKWHYYAFGNIGDSKKTDETRLTDPSDRYECILEVMDNTLPNSTMSTGKVDAQGAPVYPIDPSEWCAGNSAYDSLYDDWFDEKSAAKKGEGHTDDTYGWRYLYEDGTDEENAEAKAFVEQKWKDFYEFVVTSTDEEFKAQLGDWVVLDSIMYFYLFTLRYTMTDNHAKNSFWHYGKTGEVDTEGNPIRKWDLAFAYDMDTSLGIDNYGRMTYRYGYEEIDYVDNTSDWVWNAPQHVFFLRLRELFDEELCELYTELESLGAWSATGLINQFNNWQAQFPEELWRVDIERKYIRTYTGSFINGEAKPEFLKERANGRKKTQRAQFEKNQEKYMSSKFGGTVASSDDVILRCSVPNTDLAVVPNFDMHLTPYSHMYINVKYNTAPPVKMRAVPNTEYTIPYAGDMADIIEIYSASSLKSIGDLSSCYLINGDFSNARKIRELILGSEVEGYNNTNTMTLGLGSNELLNKLDIQNMSGLTSSLDLSGLKNLKELYAKGSNVSGILFADGGNLEIAEIPAVGSLSMKNLNYLTEDGMEIESYNSLTKLVAENSLLDLINIINNSPNLYQVRLTGIDWTLDDTSLLSRLYELAGVTNTGSNTDQSVLAGTVHVAVIGQQELAEYQSAWPDLTIVPTTVIQQFAVTFINDDNTVLDVQYVDIGKNAIDPINRSENPITTPTKESSDQFDYTFAGWDSSLTAVFADRTIKATYTATTRSYTIRYVSKGTVMQETVGLYGDNIIYEGAVPTYTLEEAAYKYYLFNRWDKSGFIYGDKTVTAIFDEFQYTDGYFANKELSELSAVEIYALTKLGLDNVVHNIEDGDDYSLALGYDVDFDDIESEEIISTKATFDGTNHLDTGIKLFDEDRDFVLAIDYKMSGENLANKVLAQCFQSNGSNGFKLWHSNGVKFTWGTSTDSPVGTGKREMIIIRHKKGENNVTVYNSNLDSLEISEVELTSNKSFISDSTLVFGCAKADDGAYENHAIGEVHWCKVWYADLGEQACRKLAGWTHEKVTMEVCGTKRYYLTENPSKRCNFNLLATHLLERNRSFNTSSTTVGGWANSALNKFLNTRLYESMSDQMKLLLKQVTVSSSVGNKSTELSTSECYIFVPALIEMTNDSPADVEPYIYEGSTISYMIDGTESNESALRKRAHDGGDYAGYWLRSPNTSYASYMYTVDADGNLYGFIGATNKLGVLIEIAF